MQIRYYLAASAAALSLATVMAAPAHAQETTSALRGSVTADGQPLPGAQVRVIHTPSGTVSTSTTDAQGNFSANGLRVGGPFVIEVSADGYEQSSVTDIFLQAGQPLRLPIELQSQAVIVVSASSVRNSLETSKGPITALSREDIDGVASINRDIRDLARRDPFVTMDLTNSRTIEIAGNNGRLNRFSVDGVQFSDDFGLNNGGLPTSRGPVPFDAIEQFSVKVAPFDIAEGDFQGGAINVVLRSGSNDFHGGAFFTYTDDSLTGDRTRGRNVALDFDSKQYGGNISGPIIKDKLFFMFAYEKTEESDPFDNGVGAGFSAQIPNLTQTQIDRISQIAQSVYGYDTLGQIQNAVEEDEKFVAKLDWNITDGHRASLTYIRNVGNQQFQQNTSISLSTPSVGLFSNGYELTEEVNSGVFQLNSQWSDNLSTEFRASYRDYNRGQTAFGDTSIGEVSVCLDETSLGSVTNCSTGVPRVFFGPDVFRHANALNTENLSLDFTGRLNVGDHDLRLMVGYTDQSTFNLFVPRSLGQFYFDSVTDFQNRNLSQLQLNNAVPSLDPADGAARFSSQSFTFGIQDDWQVTDTLQVSYGVRYDLFNVPERPAANANFLARTGFTNQFTFNGLGVVQPRIGFTWNATNRLVIRGGAGIFAGGTPDVFLSNSFSNTGQLTNQITINRTAQCNTPGSLCALGLNNVDPTTFNPAVLSFLTTNTASLAAAPTDAVDPNLKLARQMRATLSASYEADLGPLGDGWLFGATVLYGQQVYGYNWVDARSVPIGTLPDGRLRYGPVNGVPTVNRDLVMTNTTEGRSWIGSFQVEKSWDWGLTLSGSYTRSDITDVNAITSATSSSLYGNNAFIDPNTVALGRSIYEIKDQWKFGIDFNKALFDDTHMTRISLFGEYRSGRPYSITMFDNVNDASGRPSLTGTNGNNSRTLLYIPTAGADPRVTFANAATEAAFNSAIEQLGLERFRGRVVSKNTQQSPDFFKVDVHLEQEVPLLFGSKLSVFADIENVLNMIDSDWGALRQVGFPQTSSLVQATCAQANGNNCTQYRYSNVLLPNEALVTRPSLYGIRVGVRVKF
ncbi:carboxypeptidase family protein [Blastomonas natatoria]|uniref:Carboxypeptidase family protein n=1 Tax=Blastomonas natatoria TaxID=34015 RepID=A0A2V3V419_9SPHN|nr:TonB-dependent receptor [Blastomonas natatoria]PXW76417.1 carboxypeptidase family protein [Blastomonas natatoria]